MVLDFPRYPSWDGWIRGNIFRPGTGSCQNLRFSFMRASSVPLYPFVLPLVPVVQGCNASKSRLRLLLIVMVGLPMEALHQGLPVFEIDRFEDLVYPAIEPRYHPIRLGMKSRFEPMFDVMCLAGLVTGGCQKVFETLFGTERSSMLRYRQACRIWGIRKSKRNVSATPRPLWHPIRGRCRWWPDGGSCRWPQKR